MLKSYVAVFHCNLRQANCFVPCMSAYTLSNQIDSELYDNIAVKVSM